jgi:hypothetical protein
MPPGEVFATPGCSRELGKIPDESPFSAEFRAHLTEIDDNFDSTPQNEKI